MKIKLKDNTCGMLSTKAIKAIEAALAEMTEGLTETDIALLGAEDGCKIGVSLWDNDSKHFYEAKTRLQCEFYHLQEAELNDTYVSLRFAGIGHTLAETFCNLFTFYRYGETYELRHSGYACYKRFAPVDDADVVCED